MIKTKPKMDTEKTLRRLIDKYALARIELICTGKTVRANAMPALYHPSLPDRQREACVAAADESGSISISAASEISQQILRTPIAIGHGETIEDTLWDLERALKA